MAVVPTSTQRLIDEAAVAAIRRRLGRMPASPWLHAEIARRMAERLALFRMSPNRIVDWGAFLGGGGSLLTAAYPQAALIAVEPTADLAVRSRQALRSPWWSGRRWKAPPAEVIIDPTTDLPVEAELVWANMALHAVKDPPALMQRWHRMLTAGGFVMFSCLGPDTLRELRALYARLGWPAPTVDFVDMHDLGDMLLHAGFADPVMDQEALTVQWDSAEALCNDLRMLGGNACPARVAGLRTPRWLERLHRELDGVRNASGRLSVTFEIVYGHAFKVAAKVETAQETQVSLDEMRRLMRDARRAA
ncbi:MAG: class I SAM-dependent methyltransferase [Burkholderiaceae bacterium]|nr:class I SAM-dependent methyltransferase [Burkholderiaceae bacterium]